MYRKKWNYSIEDIKENLLIQFIIQILLGNWDLYSRNIEIEYDKKKMHFSPFYDFTYYGDIGRYETVPLRYAFQDQKYDNLEKITPEITLKNFLDTANFHEIETLKRYLEKIKKMSLHNNIRLIEKQTERQVPIEIKYRLIEDTQRCFNSVEDIVNSR